MTNSIEPLLSIEPLHTNSPTVLIPNDSDSDSIGPLLSIEPLHSNRPTVLIPTLTLLNLYLVLNLY